MKDRDRLFIEDARRSGHCVSGIRTWFKEAGLDFRDFMRNGVPLETIRNLRDGHGNQVIDRTAARDESKD